MYCTCTLLLLGSRQTCVSLFWGNSLVDIILIRVSCISYFKFVLHLPFVTLQNHSLAIFTAFHLSTNVPFRLWFVFISLYAQKFIWNRFDSAVCRRRNKKKKQNGCLEKITEITEILVETCLQNFSLQFYVVSLEWNNKWFVFLKDYYFLLFTATDITMLLLWRIH